MIEIIELKELYTPEPKPEIKFYVGVHLGRGLEQSALAVVQTSSEKEDIIRCLAARSLPGEYTILELADELAAVKEKLLQHKPKDLDILVDCRPVEEKELKRKLGEANWGNDHNLHICQLTTEAEESSGAIMKFNGEDIKINISILFNSQRLILPEKFQSPEQQQEMEEMLAQAAVFNPTPTKGRDPETVQTIGSQDHLAIALGLACYGAGKWAWIPSPSILF